MVGEIYSTTFEQENSGPFNSTLKVLGIIPGIQILLNLAPPLLKTRRGPCLVLVKESDKYF